MAYPNNLPESNIKQHDNAFEWWRQAIIQEDVFEGFSTEEFYLNIGAFFPSGSPTRAQFYTWIRDYWPTPPTGNLYTYELPVLDGSWNKDVLNAWGRMKLFELNIYGNVTNGSNTSNTPVITMSGRYGVNNWNRSTLLYMRFGFTQFLEYGGIVVFGEAQQMYSNSTYVAPSVISEVDAPPEHQYIEVVNITEDSARVNIIDDSFIQGQDSVSYRTYYKKASNENWNYVTNTLNLTYLSGESVYQVYVQSIGEYGSFLGASNIVIFETEVGPTLTLSRSSITVDNDAGSFSFDVNSNIKWTITDNRNWIGITMPYRNLLRNSDKSVNSGTYQMASYTLGKQIPDGAQVTMQIKGQLGSTNTFFGIYNSGGTVSINSLWPANQDSDGVYRKTFNWKVGGAANTSIRVYQMPSGASHGSTIDWIMLSEDNVVTNGEVTVGPTGNQSMKVYTLDKSIPNGTQITVQLKATLGKDYFGLYTNNGNTYVNEFWPANSTNGVFEKTFTWNGGSSKNLTVYQYGGGGTSTIEYLRVNVSDDKTWVTAPEDTLQAGIGTVENIVANVYKNFAGSRTGTITASGTGVPDRTIAVTQQSITLYSVTIRGNSFTIGEYGGAATPEAALNNMQIINVWATKPANELGLGTQLYTTSGAYETLAVESVSWFRLGTTNTSLRIDTNGYVLEAIDTTQTLNLSPTSWSPSVNGSSRTFTITSNTTWILTKSSWLSVQGGLDSGNGNSSVTIVADPNNGTDTDPRTGTVRVRTQDHYIDLIATITQPGTYVPTPPEVGGVLISNITDNSVKMNWVAATSADSTITQQYVQYRVGTTGSWTSTSVGATTTTYTLQPILSGVKYQVRIRANDAKGDVGYGNISTFTTTGGITINPTSKQFNSFGGSFSLQVNATGSWNATYLGSVYNIQPTSGNGSGNILVSVSPNSEPHPMLGNVTVNASGGSSASCQVTVLGTGGIMNTPYNFTPPETLEGMEIQGESKNNDNE